MSEVRLAAVRGKPRTPGHLSIISYSYKGKLMAEGVSLLQLTVLGTQGVGDTMVIPTVTLALEDFMGQAPGGIWNSWPRSFD